MLEDPLPPSIFHLWSKVEKDVSKMEKLEEVAVQVPCIRIEDGSKMEINGKLIEKDGKRCVNDVEDGKKWKIDG